jgi:phosphatidylserine/phosphatidylglycerophosphate/cardiolipin synthase-like enzyme
MTWLLIATGFTGAFTLVFLYRWAHRKLGIMPSVEVYFSPKGGCMDAVVRELKKARREVLVQAYSFTADPITFGLVEAKKRGAQVDIVLDRSNEQESYSDLHILLEQGLAPLIDSTHAIAHNKIIIIDKRTLITGSYNFTNQAEHENAENLVVIKGHPELLGMYRQNFMVHKAHSQQPNLKAAPQHGQRKAA